LSQGIEGAAGHKAVHLLTFDLEHWYQGYRYRGGGGWENHPARDCDTVGRLLAMLDESGAKATFFTTGVFAAEFPELIRALVKAGHEVASHSYDHILVHAFSTISEFQRDLRKSIAVIEDIAGEKVLGFRAPKWSIPHSPAAFFDALLDEGLIYDSSLFPSVFAGHVPRQPYRGQAYSGRQIWEFPATTFNLGPFRIPAAGGLWLRLFPGGLSRAALMQGERAGQPRMVYLHPYDIDAECPVLWRGLGLKSFPFLLARHYRLGRADEILQAILREFQFVSIRNHLCLDAANNGAQGGGGKHNLTHCCVQ